MAHIRQILANLSISISDFKKNPKSVIKAAQNEPIAVIMNNKPAFYCVPADILESLYQKFYEMNDMTLQNLQSLDSSGNQNDIEDNENDDSFGVTDVFQAIEDENVAKLSPLTHTDELIDPLTTKVSDPLDDEVAHQINLNLDNHFLEVQNATQVPTHNYPDEHDLLHEDPLGAANAAHRRIEGKALLHEVINDVNQEIQDSRHNGNIISGPHSYSLEHVAKAYSPYKAQQLHKSEQSQSKKDKKSKKERKAQAKLEKAVLKKVHKYPKSLKRLQGSSEFTSERFKETIHTLELPPHTDMDINESLLPNENQQAPHFTLRVLSEDHEDIQLEPTAALAAPENHEIEEVKEPEEVELIEDSADSDKDLAEIERVVEDVIEREQEQDPLSSQAILMPHLTAEEQHQVQVAPTTPIEPPVQPEQTATEKPTALGTKRCSACKAPALNESSTPKTTSRTQNSTSTSTVAKPRRRQAKPASQAKTTQASTPTSSTLSSTEESKD